jgi:hypothetical protein
MTSALRDFLGTISMEELRSMVDGGIERVR